MTDEIQTYDVKVYDTLEDLNRGIAKEFIEELNRLGIEAPVTEDHISIVASVFQAYFEAIRPTIERVWHEDLAAVRESILHGAKFEQGVITDTLWMKDDKQGTVVDFITNMIGDDFEPAD